MIYIFSSKNSILLKKALKMNTKNPWAAVFDQVPKNHQFRAGDQAYLDISGLSPADLKKALGKLKKNSAAFWGIIDPKGAAGDPASFFFKGAGDYIGPALVKKGLSKKRFYAALPWTSEKKRPGGAAANEAADRTEDEAAKKIYRLPPGKFEGWKSIHTGTNETFLFLFVTLSGKTNIRALIGEAAFITVKKRLREILQQGFREADALLWMETEDSHLFLVPPKTTNCKTAIETAMKMILNSRLISIEKLDITVPVNFTFALHYGKTIFQEPGKTGTIISEAVNYIFHLGAKKAESGRLTISDTVPKSVIPEGLQDLFSPTGIYEGIPIYHSRRFIYK